QCLRRDAEGCGRRRPRSQSYCMVTAWALVIPVPPYAPNLSNIRALACIRRIKYFDSNTPSEPRFAPVSVNRSSLSHPLNADTSNTGCGCHECPLTGHGVE